MLASVDKQMKHCKVLNRNRSSPPWDDTFPMDKYCCLFPNRERDTHAAATRVCVKQVKQDASEEWDETMPLPGDVIEGFSEDDSGEFFLPAKAKSSEISWQLGQIGRQVETIWLKVRRGDKTLKLRAGIVKERCSLLKRRFTIKAATDDRHVAVLANLTNQECGELQEMSRRVVSVDFRGFGKTGVGYDWNKAVGAQLPDKQCSVFGSILFLPLQSEYYTEATTARCMAWFSAAVSSGVPLVFVNIQTEESMNLEKKLCTGKEPTWSAGRPNSHNAAPQPTVQGVRLWFLPGIAEDLLVLMPRPGEDRYGMDIRRSEEGFICVYSVTKDLAADRAGMGSLHEEAKRSGHLLVVSRLEGKSLMPSSACSLGLIHCCDHNEVRDILASAIHLMDPIRIHFMVRPKANQSQTFPTNTSSVGVAAVRPPDP